MVENMKLFYCKFIAKSYGERFLKIGQRVPKLCTNVEWNVFIDSYSVELHVKLNVNFWRLFLDYKNCGNATDVLPENCLQTCQKMKKNRKRGTFIVQLFPESYKQPDRQNTESTALGSRLFCF